MAAPNIDIDVGDRVLFHAPYNLFHLEVDIAQGEQGTIVDTFDGISVRMDQRHDGLADWDNEVIFTDMDPGNYIRPLVCDACGERGEHGIDAAGRCDTCGAVAR